MTVDDMQANSLPHSDREGRMDQSCLSSLSKLYIAHKMRMIKVSVQSRNQRTSQTLLQRNSVDHACWSYNPGDFEGRNSTTYGRGKT